VAFCAPSERAALAAGLGDLPGLELASGDTDDFFARLCRVAAFVGLDSFGIHAAHAIGVPSIMLNGANLAEAIKPPQARLIDGGIGVSCHPCYNKPTCTATAEPYRCIRAIAETQVLRGLQVLLAASG
jgi:heptosyltransferase-3